MIKLLTLAAYEFFFELARKLADKLAAKWAKLRRKKTDGANGV